MTKDFDERLFLKRDMEYREQNCEKGYLSRVLQLVTSNTCNFRCKYCFEKSMYKDPTRIKHQIEEGNQFMTFDVAKKAMDNMVSLLKKNGNKVLTVEFFGGEPLTNWSLVKQVLETYKNGDDEVRIVYSITTNGSLITEEMSSLFKKYGVTVNISFDSPQSTERVRVEPAGHIYICKCCSRYLGEVDRFEDVLKTDGFKEYSMRAYLNAEECRGCEIEGFCSGVCMGGLEKKYEKLYGIEESSCEIFKAITHKLIWIHFSAVKSTFSMRCI